MEFTNEELYDIGCNQKKILYLILIGFLIIPVAAVASIYYAYIQIAYSIASIVYLYKFARSLKTSIPAIVFLLILIFIPLIGLIILLAINGKATKVLLQKGIRVGLMGASQADLEKLKEKPGPQ